MLHDDRLDFFKFRWLFVAMIAAFILVIPIFLLTDIEGMETFIFSIFVYIWFIFITNKHSIQFNYLPFKETTNVRIVIFALVSLFVLEVFSASIELLLLVIVAFIKPSFIELLNTSPSSETIATTATLGVTLATTVRTVILTPVIEEYIFRGILLRKLIRRFSLMSGIILSSAIFAVLHIGGGILHAFLLGLLMAFLYLKTKNIWISIMLHSITNGTVLLYQYIYTNFIDDPSYIISVQDYQEMVGSVLAIFFVTLLIVIWIFYKYIQAVKDDNKLQC